MAKKKQNLKSGTFHLKEKIKDTYMKHTRNDRTGSHFFSLSRFKKMPVLRSNHCPGIVFPIFIVLLDRIYARHDLC